MKVKKYIAATMPEVMQQIRADLGSDAVILNSKEVNRGGFFGLFKKKSIEVVAALDPKPMAPKDNFNIPIQHVQESNQNKDVLNEIKYLKKILEQQAAQKETNYVLDYQLAYEYLLDQEVSKKIAKQIIDAVIVSHKEKGIKHTPLVIMEDIKLEIESRLSNTSFNGITYEQQVVHFVGPTGVGKTTTLAKIAAESILKDHKSVAFITSDTYRIAAIDQLKTYARILNAPIEVAYTIEDYHRALDKFSAYDLILVDTAGRNFRDEKYVKELLGNIELNIKTYIVLSLTAKQKDISEIYAQFRHLRIKEVIFTKLDETRQYGSILNIALENEIGIAYVTNGQDVPEDLIQPTPQDISNYIIGGYYNE